MKCQFKGCNEKGIAWKDTRRYCNKCFYKLKKSIAPIYFKMEKICEICKKSYLGIARSKYCSNCKDYVPKLKGRKIKK